MSRWPCLPGIVSYRFQPSVRWEPGFAGHEARLARGSGLLVRTVVVHGGELKLLKTQ